MFTQYFHLILFIIFIYFYYLNLLIFYYLYCNFNGIKCYELYGCMHYIIIIIRTFIKCHKSRNIHLEALYMSIYTCVVEL